MDQTRKKVKKEPHHVQLAPGTRIFVSLANPFGEETSKSLELPIETTKAQLQEVLNQLLGTEEEQVYSFFHKNIELLDNLAVLVQSDPEYKLENTFQVTYHPQSLFKIQPITRQTAALDGHEQPVLTVAFKTTGDVLATGSGDTTIRLWDMQTETPIAVLKGGHSNHVLTICWSPNCKFLISGGLEGWVCVWDTQTNKQVGMPLKGHSKWITSLAWEPMHLNEECTLFASSSKDGTARVWSRVSLSCLICINAHQKSITKMLWGGSGLIYTASEDTTIGVWNKSGKRVRELKGHAHWVNSIALHTDFTVRMACFSEESQELQPEAAKTRYEKILGKGERLVSGSDDMTLCLWELGSSKPKSRMTGHQQQVNHVQFSPDGRYIVSASFDKSLRIWDGYNGDWIATLRGHVGPVYQVCWSSDSRYMLSASKDSTLKLWSLQKKKLAFDLPGHADEVYAVDWAPIGGEKAGSGGKDKKVKIWRN